MNKSKFFLCVFSVFALFALGGCVKKSAVTTTESPVAEATAQTEQSASTVPPGADVQIEATAGTSSSGKSDNDQLKIAYDNNYKAASQNANGSLQNTAKFCAVVIEFPVGQISKATQSFYFDSTNSALKDWFWVVEFNQLENKRLELFAAKRDYKDLVCTTFENGTPTLSFSEAYGSVQSSGALAAELTDSAVKTKIILSDKAWKFEVWGKDGKILANPTYNATNAFVETNPTASPTS